MCLFLTNSSILIEYISGCMISALLESWMTSVLIPNGKKQEEGLSAENQAASSDSCRSLSELCFTDKTNAGRETNREERVISDRGWTLWSKSHYRTLGTFSVVWVRSSLRTLPQPTETIIKIIIKKWFESFFKAKVPVLQIWKLLFVKHQ